VFTPEDSGVLGWNFHLLPQLPQVLQILRMNWGDKQAEYTPEIAFKWGAFHKGASCMLQQGTSQC
jgi:hypothetical protein